MAKNLNVKHNNQSTDTWLTPPEIVSALGPFDLDPCTPIFMPWDTAEQRYTESDDGLSLPWYGRVWLNPPYSKLKNWLGRMADHGNGIALTFARTETQAFHQFIFPYAYSLFFFQGRLYFYNEKGERARFNAGAPSCLISYTEQDSEKIDEADFNGCHLHLQGTNIILIDRGNKTWRIVVDDALSNLGGQATLQEIYEQVIKLAERKVKRNRHFKAKVRQTLQRYFDKTDVATYKNRR